MTGNRPNPIRETDDAVRAEARALLEEARFGALGVLDPESGAPMVTRVAVGTTPGGAPLTLISALSQHTAALGRSAACSLLVGEPKPTGDPLTHPRLTLQCDARFVARGTPEHDRLRGRWLASHPKSKLYVDFADFSFVVLEPRGGFLNGGFGKAYLLTAEDLLPPA
ncbi:HugZ family protein [Tropicimonas sp. IMCC6043]|uniref:HugZ family pyridoxamine 5'-phosphate oxidase n=1 Tax=Tropicimonas sp. IMCC6043 TaxID=2510645 RepID=UPI00101DA4F7|nr:pyridoxamine 5'-phosphate oxidase family protein [Tropicimonas sp. IMCC6043]RYH06862.1 HugZ family protein [Tropicimonas sp. IMCC6043]